jgi:hypothetical protein
MTRTKNERVPPGGRHCAGWDLRWGGHGTGHRARNLAGRSGPASRAHHLRAGARNPQRRRVLDADRAGADAARSPRRHGGPAAAWRGGFRAGVVSAAGPQSDGGRAFPAEGPRAGGLRGARHGHRAAGGTERSGGAGRTQPGWRIGQPCRRCRPASAPPRLLHGGLLSQPRPAHSGRLHGGTRERERRQPGRADGGSCCRDRSDNSSLRRGAGGLEGINPAQRHRGSGPTWGHARTRGRTPRRRGACTS